MTRPDDFAFQTECSDGLTKREYIATAVLQGIISRQRFSIEQNNIHNADEAGYKTAAFAAVKITDILIEQLNKKYL